MKSDWINNNEPIAIIGDPNSGKTNLAFYLLSLVSGRDKYLFAYPKEIPGFITINDINDLTKIKDCVVFIDEIQRYFKLYEKRSNEKLMELLSFCEHQNVKLIFSTQLSQFITKQCEAFIRCWAIKRTNLHTLKNGSMPKIIIKSEIQHTKISPQFGMTLETNEFAWYRMYAEAGENGVYEFPDMKIGKDWRKEERPELNTEENTEPQIQNEF